MSAGIAPRLAAVAEDIMGGALPVRIKAWDGSVAGPADATVLVLRSPKALRRLLLNPGELGLAQAYVTGELDVEGDLAQGLREVWAAVRAAGLKPRRITAREYPRLAATAMRMGVVGLPPKAPASQAKLTGRLHSLGRDRAAISHHYDLSNDFYGLILDEDMLYSSGYWTSAASDYTLVDAQRDKLDMICRKLGIGPGMRMLDIGCGWGALAIHAARCYGVHVTGVTLSKEQLAFGQARVNTLGLTERVDLRLQDYRNIDDGPFDAISSIEMGEHVGQDNYPVYTATMYKLLRPEGRLLLQQMSRGSSHPGGGPFIESFIAPDMYMRPTGATLTMLTEAGFEVRDVHAMREHYVTTVEAWYRTFERRYDQIVALVGEEVARVWRLYLVGGALAFEQGRMGVDQFLAVKPTPTGKSGMPAIRDAWTVPVRQTTDAAAQAAQR